MRPQAPSFVIDPMRTGFENDVAEQGRILVAEVRAAAERHRLKWEAMVPDPHTVDLTHEPAEEAAYAEMAEVKHRLRDHICETYGISVAELISLAG